MHGVLSHLRAFPLVPGEAWPTLGPRLTTALLSSGRPLQMPQELQGEGSLGPPRPVPCPCPEAPSPA